MKNLLIFLALLTVGCQEPKQPTIESGKPAEGGKPSTDQPVTLESGFTEFGPLDTEPQKQDPRHKPERIHQLKDLKTRKMPVNGHTLTLWIMDDDSKRAEGMMYLEDKDVKDTEGMLFLFDTAEPRSFWMRNCPLGLDICYIDPKGKVLNVGVGKPFDESGVPSEGDAQYVLELKVGRAKKFGIKPGTVLKLPKD